MSLIHQNGCECLLSSMELFSVPPTQASIDKGVFNRYFPLTSLERGPIEFRVNSSEFEYLDLNHIYLYTKNRIMDANGLPIPSHVTNTGGERVYNDAGIVFPVNNFHSSRFKTLEVYINNQQVNETDAMYPYRSYLECLLSYNKGAKETLGGMIMWAKDGPDPDNNFADLASTEEDELTDQTNRGAWKRWQATKFSSSFETLGKVHSEILAQSRLLPANTELRLRFHRADPAFALMAKKQDRNYTINIDSAMLLVRHVEIASAIREAHAKAALVSNYKFPVRKVKDLFFTHSSGRQDLSVHNLITGRLPRRVVLGFVKSSSFHGDLATSPFNFMHFNLTTISLRMNGQSLPIESGISGLNYKRGTNLLGFWSLLQGTGNLFTNEDLDISPWGKDYSHGNCLYAFDLSPEMQSGNTDHFDLIREGKLDVEAKLATSTKESVTMIAHLEYDGILEMTKDGDIISET